MTRSRVGTLRSLGFLAILALFSAGTTARADLAVSAEELETFFSLDPMTLTDLGNGPAFNGSGILTSLTVVAGDELSFRYNFLTNEVSDLGNTINDFAFLTVDGVVTQFADVVSLPLVSSSAPGFASETGFQTYTFRFTNSGLIALGFGVVNVTDGTFDSGLLIDDLMLNSALISGGGFESGVYTGDFSPLGNASVVGAFGSLPPGGDFQAFLSTSAVPEPASLAMMGFGAVTLLARRRIRSRAARRSAA